MIGGAFILFGIIAWVLYGTFSVAYVGLALFGVIAIVIGWFSPK
jgi:hypothetical protein